MTLALGHWPMRWEEAQDQAYLRLRLPWPAPDRRYRVERDAVGTQTPVM